MFFFPRFFSISLHFGLALTLILAANLSALEYEFSDEGALGVEFEGGRTEYEFADINKDGHVDILSIGDHGSPEINTNQHGIMVFFGDGTGRWNVTMRGDFGYGGIAVGDVNDDGDWDVGYANHHPYTDNDFGNQMIEVALGDGSGENWEPYDDGLAVPRGDDDWYGMFGMDFGDFNNDGLLDIGSNSFGSGTGLHVYANNGDGSWEDVLYHFWRNNSCMDFVFGDMDNDGNLDFACALEALEIHFGDGEGNFEFRRHNLPDPDEFDVYLSVDLCDVDNDGADDLGISDHEGRLGVYTFDPEGERWNDISDGLPRNGIVSNVNLCDMDIDGDADIVFSNGDGIEVWLQDPGANPRWSQEWSMGFDDFGGIRAIQVGGDIDHNGMPDIVLLVRIVTGFMQTRNFMHVLRETSVADELWIRPVEPGGGEVFTAGSVRFIDWAAAIPGDFDANRAVVDIFFSARGPDDEWDPIAEGIANGGRYQWIVPQIDSRNCHLRFVLDVGDAVVEIITPEPFSIIGGEPVPMLSVDPLRMEFREVEVGQPMERPLTISNTGFAELTVQPIELANGNAFFIEREGEEFVIEAEGSVELMVTFDPPEAGFWDDFIQINSNGGNCEVWLIGTTEGYVGPLIEVDGDAIDFGRIRVGEMESIELVATNQGDDDAVINIPGSGEGVFFWEAVENEIVQPENSISIPIDFSPEQYGLVDQIITLRYQADEISVDLTGFGFGQAALGLSVYELDFGEVVVNRSSEMEVVIHSLGDEPAVINVPRPEDRAFSIDPINEQDLNPGDSLIIPVTFGPDRGIDFSTELIVSYQVEDFSLALTGSGAFRAMVETSHDTIDFGEILVENRRIRNLIIRSTGNEVANVNIGRPTGGAFSCNQEGDFELAPGDSVVARVSFGPWMDMDYSGTMTISYEEEDKEIFLLGRAVTEFSVNENPEISHSFGFVELSPNPFNSQLNIKYALDRTSEVELSVCDLRGRFLSSITNKTQNSGLHTVIMPAEGLTTGTYLIVMKHEGRREIGKVVYLK